MKNIKQLKTKLFSIAFFILLSTTCIGQWNQLGVDIDGEAAGDQSGHSVSMSANGLTVAIGAPKNFGFQLNAGHVRIYQWNGSSWVQLGAEINGEAGPDNSGHSVSLSADGLTVAIGAPNNNANFSNDGHVRIYKWNGSSWVQQGADIDGEGIAAGSGNSGFSVNMSADGLTVAIGDNYNDVGGPGTGYTGHVRVYKWNGSSWVQQGADIDGEAAGDWSGYSVSMSDDASTVAIGANKNDGNGADAGHVRIYQWNGSSWMQQGADIDGEAIGDESGWSISMSADGLKVAIGANKNDGNGANAGHVRIYQWNGSSWMQQGADIDGEAAGDEAGTSVSMSADGLTVAIGARWNDGIGSNAGHVRIYKWNGSSWVQQGVDIDGEATGDEAGWSVSMSANGLTVAIGANRNDGIGSNAGHARVYSFDCTAVTGTDTQVACNSYDWIDGNTYTATNNTATWTETNVAGCDSIITLDLTVYYSNTGIDVQTACETYDWIDGNTYTATNNTATWTLTNVAGCDSIVTLDLTINSLPDNNVTQAGSLLTSDQTGATYQWLDCDNNNSVINGETNQTYNPTVTGNYSVEVTLNGCVDTSACMLVDFTGLDEINKSAIKVYPNPTKASFNIEVDANIVGSNYVIYDQLGKVVQNAVIHSSSQIINLVELSKGIYNLMIVNSDIHVKLIKE